MDFSVRKSTRPLALGWTAVAGVAGRPTAMITSPPGRVRSNSISMSVCLSVCVSVCLYALLSVHSHISKTACPNFTKCFVLITCGGGCAFVWRQCDTYVLPVLWITSYFHEIVRMSTVWFSHIGTRPYTGDRRKHKIAIEDLFATFFVNPVCVSASLNCARRDEVFYFRLPCCKVGRTKGEFGGQRSTIPPHSTTLLTAVGSQLELGHQTVFRHFSKKLTRNALTWGRTDQFAVGLLIIIIIIIIIFLYPR